MATNQPDGHGDEITCAIHRECTYEYGQQCPMCAALFRKVHDMLERKGPLGIPYYFGSRIATFAGLDRTASPYQQPVPLTSVQVTVDGENGVYELMSPPQEVHMLRTSEKEIMLRVGKAILRMRSRKGQLVATLEAGE